MPKDESGLQEPFWRNLFTVCAVYAALIAVLAAASGCSWTDRELQDASDTVGWFGQMFGPQGVVASGAITAVMGAAVQVYRSVTGQARYEKYAKKAAEMRDKKAQAARAKIAAELQGTT